MEAGTQYEVEVDICKQGISPCIQQYNQSLRNIGPLVTHRVPIKDSDQTVQIHSLI